MSTRGIRFLRDRGVPFEELEYVYKKKGAGRAADAVGWRDLQELLSAELEDIVG